MDMLMPLKISYITPKEMYTLIWHTILVQLGRTNINTMVDNNEKRSGVYWINLWR